MMKLIFGCELFVFIFCCLICIKTIYNAVKVIVLKEGSITSSKNESIIFGCALSYIITMLIIGF